MLRLHRMLHEVREDPISQRERCLHIQEDVLQRVLYLENRIRRYRRILKSLKAQLSSKIAPLLSKNEARLVKVDIRRCDQRIAQYQHLLWTFKSIADGLAFIYIDRWDIKPMVFKESSGFISQKRGLASELKFLRHVFAKGGVAILNDLTNCLHTGDVCVALENRPYIFEIKSSRHQNARVKRQRNHIDAISKYLYFDRTDRLYGIDGDFRRYTAHSKEMNNLDRLNSILTSAKVNARKCCVKEVENGLYYGATYAEHDHMLDPIVRKRPGKLIISMLNEWKHATVGYYPFSLSFRDFHAWYDFCRGELLVFVAVDFEIIAEKLLSAGLSVKWNPNPDWSSESYLEASNVKAGATFEKLLIGGHFLGRLFTEFLSLDWTLQSIIDRVSKSESERS